MSFRSLIPVIAGLLMNVLANAQAKQEYAWWDPGANYFPVIEGQAWHGEVQVPYDRLPARAEKTEQQLLFIDPGTVLLGAQGRIDEALFIDGLHPNAAGYARLAPLLAGYLKD